MGGRGRTQSESLRITAAREMTASFLPSFFSFFLALVFAIAAGEKCSARRAQMDASKRRPPARQAKGRRLAGSLARSLAGNIAPNAVKLK